MSTASHRPILVIDDDADLRGALAHALRADGIDVVEAENGSVALHLMVDSERVVPSLIVLDMVMPAMSGWEFLTILKRYVRFTSIPIIIVSGVQPNPITVDRGAVAAWVHKPYELAQLVALVKRHAAIT